MRIARKLGDVRVRSDLRGQHSGAVCAQKPDGRGGRKTECRERSCKTHAPGLCARGGDVTEGNGLLMQARVGKIVGEMSLARQEEMGSSEDSFGEACAPWIHPRGKAERVCPD